MPSLLTSCLNALYEVYEPKDAQSPPWHLKSLEVWEGLGTSASFAQCVLLQKPLAKISLVFDPKSFAFLALEREGAPLEVLEKRFSLFVEKLLQSQATPPYCLLPPTYNSSHFLALHPQRPPLCVSFRYPEGIKLFLGL